MPDPGRLAADIEQGEVEARQRLTLRIRIRVQACLEDVELSAQDGVARARLARDDATEDTAALGRAPIDDVSTTQDFELGLGERLALFKGDRHRVLTRALAAELRGALND